MKIQVTKPKSINKIVVVGHPLSGYQAVETLLNACGMNPAKPSRREGCSPAEISATLCKAHRVPPLNPLHSDTEIEQIDAGPIWHGLALDLLMGNIDQEFWGWADPQSVYLLNYWKVLDPQLAFVLVYDTPEQLVARAFDAQTPLSPEALRQATDNWSAYNAAILHFYHRNSERCLLVHAQQVRASASAYLQQVRTRIGAPVLAGGPHTSNDHAIEPAQRHATAPQEDALKAYIAHALIQQQPDTIQLYEELQSVANLPLAEHSADPYNPVDAWISMAERAKDIEQLSRDKAKFIEEHTDQIERLRKQLATQPQLAVNPELKQENELLLLQLHQAQEELERYYNENQRLKQKATQKPAAPAKPALKGAADRVKRQLSYRLGATMIAQSRSFTGCLAMPWALLKQVREYRREKKEQRGASLTPITHYDDADEADRVKRHLSYRLGAVIIANAHSPLGWLKMPWMLRREALAFKRTRGTK